MEFHLLEAAGGAFTAAEDALGGDLSSDAMVEPGEGWLLRTSTVAL